MSHPCSFVGVAMFGGGGERGGQQQHAVFLLQAMCAQQVWPNTTSYNAAVSACAQGKCWERALQVLKDCKAWATPDTVSYNAAITACEKGSGVWEGGSKNEES